MLANAIVAHTLPVEDIGRARKFYVDTLGIPIADEHEMAVTLRCGGDTSLHLYQRPRTTTDHTVAGFEVTDIEAEVKELKAKGVAFQDIDMPEMGIKTVNSIAEKESMKAAWFEDTEGNILGIIQKPK